MPVSLDLVNSGHPAMTPLGGDLYAPVVTIGAGDAAGRVQVAQPQIVFSSTSTYDKNPLQWEEMTSGTGNTVTFDTDKRLTILTLGGTAAGHAVMQTRQYIPYQPWRQQEFVMTGAFMAAVAGVTKRLGAFDARNGVYFEQNGATDYAVARRTSTGGSVSTVRYAQSEWDDPLDGTGPSAITADLTQALVFVVRLVYLGVAIVQWGIYVEGQLIIVKSEELSGTLQTSYMQYASLPLRYELSSASATASTMRMICTAVNSNGGYYSEPQASYSVGRSVGTPVACGTAMPVVAIRPALLYGGVTNRVDIRVSDIEIFASNASIEWSVRYYPPGGTPPVTGGAWAAPNPYSAAETNLGGTTVDTSIGIEIARGYAAAAAGGGPTGLRSSSGGNVSLFFPLSLTACGSQGTTSPLLSNQGTSPAYVVVTAQGIAGSVTGALWWTEVKG